MTAIIGSTLRTTIDCRRSPFDDLTKELKTVYFPILGILIGIISGAIPIGFMTLFVSGHPIFSIMAAILGGVVGVVFGGLGGIFADGLRYRTISGSIIGALSGGFGALPACGMIRVAVLKDGLQHLSRANFLTGIGIASGVIFGAIIGGVIGATIVSKQKLNSSKG